MSSAGLAISALGMASALGRDVVTSCAAARAGLAQPVELTSLDFGSEALFGEESLSGAPVVFGHVLRGAADGFTGVGKALVHGVAALDDLMRRRPLTDHERARTGLVLNVSDHAVEDLDARLREVKSAPSVRWKSLTDSLPRRLAESRGLVLAANHQVVHRGGNAGGATSLADAMTRIQKGEIDRCIVGGIDARTEPGFLKAAARLFQLRTVDNPVGLCPGEAAAFYLVEREADSTRAGYEPLARIAGSWATREATGLLDEQPPAGAGLAEVLHAALASLGSESARPWVLADLNGTSRRASEWAHALVRIRASRAFDADEAWFPATSFGDVGAAAAAVSVCCVARAFARGYAKRDQAVIGLSSESGAKGSISLTRPRSQ